MFKKGDIVKVKYNSYVMVSKENWYVIDVIGDGDDQDLLIKDAGFYMTSSLFDLVTSILREEE